MCVFPNHAFAQDENALKFESVDVSFGRGVISSGVDINVAFKSENTTLRITGNQTRVHGRFQLTKLIPMVKLGATAGFYKDAVWGGLQVAIQPFEFLSTLHWYGIMAGLPDKPEWTLNEFINYHSVTISAFNFDATFATLGVTQTWKRCIELKFTQSVNREWKCYASTGYDITNKFPLYSMGIRYTPQ
jgi:hypothetical protein